MDLSRMVSEMASEWSETQRRLGETQQAVINLADAQKQTNASLEKLLSKIDDRVSSSEDAHRRDINKLSEQIDARTRTDVGKLVAGIVGVVGLVFAILTGWGQGDSVRLASIEEEARAISRKADEHRDVLAESDKALAITNERSATNARDILKLDVSLQREMRDLDERLQNEFNARIGNNRESIVAIDRQLEARMGTRFTKTDGVELRKELLAEVNAAKSRLGDVETQMAELRGKMAQ